MKMNEHSLIQINETSENKWTQLKTTETTENNEDRRKQISTNYNTR